jgi:predicted acyltransferase
MVIGANSIAIYVMAWTMEHFVSESLTIHLGTAPFLVLGPPFEPVLRGIGVLIVFWSILYWMYRRRIFIKI